MANPSKSTADKTIKPNIVLILVDNVGGGILAHTEAPHARRELASRRTMGIRFLNYNVENPMHAHAGSHHDRTLLGPFGHVHRADAGVDGMMECTDCSTGRARRQEIAK